MLYILTKVMVCMLNNVLMYTLFNRVMVKPKSNTNPLTLSLKLIYPYCKMLPMSSSFICTDIDTERERERERERDCCFLNSICSVGSFSRTPYACLASTLLSDWPQSVIVCFLCSQAEGQGAPEPSESVHDQVGLPRERQPQQEDTCSSPQKVSPESRTVLPSPAHLC